MTEREQSPEAAVTREQAIADVAELLYADPGQLEPSMDLADQGMDSVRIMQLVERWRSAGAEGVDFIILAQDQRLEAWLDQLARLQSA
ncbi:phosphopantetheine-binding protein [Nesterenkonia populi]